LNLTLAVSTAVSVLLLGGVGYRVIANRYARPVDSVKLPPGTLAKLPLEIGNWSGKDSPLEDAIVEQTDTDAHVNRTYINRAASQAVSLFVGYGIRLRDLMPHRPEVCYPGGGWTADGATDVELLLADGSMLPCRILRFRRGGLSNDRITVLNYYVVDGECCADVSVLRSKAWRAAGGDSYAVQVQVVADTGPFRPEPESAVREFAALCALELRKLLPDASGPDQVEADRNSTSTDRG